MAGAGTASSGTISVYRNTSTVGSLTRGSFGAKADLTTPSVNEFVEVADVDGDGKLDVIGSNAIANSISIFRNISTSGQIDSNSFAARVDFGGLTQVLGLAVGDVDGDGKPDILAPNNTDRTVSVCGTSTTAEPSRPAPLTARSISRRWAPFGLPWET